MKNYLNVSRALFAIVILFAFSTPTASFAQAVPACSGTTFDTFATGTVNGQGGWSVINSALDQSVVENTYGYSTFGCKSLRISNATTSQLIFNQIFSNFTAAEAGETGALDSNGFTGTTNNRFEAQFDLASVMPAEQPGMHMSVSADRGDGTRMSTVAFADTAAGIDVFFDDVIGTTTPVTFRESTIATGLSRAIPHTIKLLMDFIEGPSNDIVQVFIDGSLVHTGTSWENFHRFDADAFPSPTDTSRTVRSLVFYEQLPGTPANLSNGYLIDNVSLLATTTPATTTPPISTSTPPVITLNGSSTMNVTVNTTFTDPGATATDDIDGTVPVTATGTVDTAVVGGYIILYTATDSHSNIATTTRTVNVVAAPASTSTVPIITLNGSSTMNIFLNSVFTDPGATAVSGTTTVPVIATGTVDTAVIGSYSILYTATSSTDEIATTTRTVNVVSTSTPPTITLNGSSTVSITQNTTFTDPGATAVNAIGASVPVTATGTVNTAAIGDYTITYTATDTNNNVATTTRTVSVVAAPADPVAPPVSSGGGGGGSGYYPPVPGMPGFVFAPLPGQTAIVVQSPTESTIAPITVGVISTPTGQVLGAATYNFTRNLRFGSRGVDVMELQKFLISRGFLVLANPTQYFGSLTRAAVVRWQASVGLPSTGYFGPMSRAAIIR